MKKVPTVTKKVLFQNFNPQKKAKEYINFIKNTKTLVNSEMISPLDIQNHFKFLKAPQSQRKEKISTKASFLYATHILQPKIFQKFIQTKQVENPPSWYETLRHETFIDAQKLIPSNNLLKITNAMESFQVDVSKQVRFHQRILNLEIDAAFMASAIDRYKKFLQLRMENPKLVVVPTIDIDLIWHAHMLDHTEYVLDCMNLFGNILNHDTKAEETRLKKNYQKTSDVWEKRFNEKYVTRKKDSNVGCGGCLSCGFGENSTHQSRVRGDLLEHHHIEIDNTIDSSSDFLSDVFTADCLSC
eukprot:gene2117-1984_t